MKSFRFIITSLAFLLISCENQSTVNIKPDQESNSTAHETITLGGGCYWCVEAVFQQLDGVISSTSGFMGGHVPDPTYEEVIGGYTGHIEVINIVYDPVIISTEKILEWFWKAHDPTNPIGQGADIGERYTSNIFYHSGEQKEAAERSMTTAQEQFEKPIATRIRAAETFYKAKEDHQDYYARNKEKNRYCPAVITPKLKKLGLEY